MPMHNNGLTKLQEECGELIQVCAKKSTYINAEIHPDGSNMKDRLEEEIADVLASCDLVLELHGLDAMKIANRRLSKLQIFKKWHEDEKS